MNAQINHISKKTFEKEVIQSKAPVLIDFWAPWCSPCHALAPIVEEIANDYEGKLKVVKINTDENPELADQFQITTIPTILLYTQENEVARTIGVQPRDNLEAFINEHVL